MSRVGSFRLEYVPPAPDGAFPQVAAFVVEVPGHGESFAAVTMEQLGHVTLCQIRMLAERAPDVFEAVMREIGEMLERYTNAGDAAKSEVDAIMRRARRAAPDLTVEPRRGRR